MKLPVRVLLVGTSAVFAVVACSSDDVPDDQVIVPLEAAPDGWEESTFEWGTVATPADWGLLEMPDEELGAVNYLFQPDFNDHGTQGGLDVTVWNSSEQDAAAAAKRIEDGYSEIFEIVSDVVREEVAWPGAEEAWFVEFTAQVRSGEGERAPQVTRHLILDLENGDQIWANVTGLESDFGPQRFGDALASLSVS